MNDVEVDDYIEKRDAALRSLDIGWARKQTGGGSDDMLLLALHKSRYEAVKIEPELRQASRVWLEERGYSRIGMLPWSHDGSLPE